MRFVEKPNLETAQAYVRSGDYLWNPGVFVWKNSTLLDAYKQHQSAIYDTLTSVPLGRVDQVYPSAPRETIDTGIMEPARNVATIPAQFGWNDIGSWAEFWELAQHDADDNVAQSFGCDVSGLVDPVVADGYYLMLAPLTPGQHTLNFGGTIGDPINFTLDITYNFTVTG